MEASAPPALLQEFYAAVRAPFLGPAGGNGFRAEQVSLHFSFAVVRLVGASHEIGGGPGADSEEKREPASDVDTALVDSLKAPNPNRPIREADIARTIL